MKKCNGCGRELDISKFYIRKDNSPYPVCIECCKKYSHTSYLKNKEKLLECGKLYVLSNPHRTWAKGTINNHKLRKCTFNFSVEELTKKAQSVTHCPICGSPLIFGGEKPHRNTPTLDRIYGDRELTLDNTNIICYTCNSAKGVMTYNELIKYCNDEISKSGDKYGICN